MTRINLNYKQIKWLDSRGGRNVGDVMVDKGGLYVMFGLNEDQKVYLPESLEDKKCNK